MFIDLRETDLLPGSQFCNEIYAILHSAKTNNNTMKPINRAKQRWVKMGRPKIVKVWTCESDRFLALPAKLIHGPAFVIQDYVDSAIENKSDYWFEIMPKDKWHQCAHSDHSRLWYDNNEVAYENENGSNDDDESVVVEVPPDGAFLGEIELSSDETEEFPDDIEDSSLEEEYVCDDGVDL